MRRGERDRRQKIKLKILEEEALRRGPSGGGPIGGGGGPIGGALGGGGGDHSLKEISLIGDHFQLTPESDQHLKPISN